jgi:hypothetical protein
VALGRLARAYEADPDKGRDLLPEIHFALWRSFDPELLSMLEKENL